MLEWVHYMALAKCYAQDVDKEKAWDNLPYWLVSWSRWFVINSLSFCKVQVSCLWVRNGK